MQHLEKEAEIGVWTCVIMTLKHCVSEELVLYMADKKGSGARNALRCSDLPRPCGRERLKHYHNQLPDQVLYSLGNVAFK